METLARVQDIMRDIFDINDLVVKPEMSAKDVDEWDSLSHVTLIVEIEKAFKIRFALGELENLKNVGEMISLIDRKIS